MPPAMREGGRLVVIGGVAAGMSAASRARRLRPDIEIVVFEKGRDVSYASCLMPYFVSGEIESRDRLIRYTADFFRTERHIDVRTETEATAVDTTGRTVTFRGTDGAESSISYDTLVIATGARAAKPPLPGIDMPGVYTLRNIADGERLREIVDTGRVRKAVIVGGGYIGLETTEALVSRGVDVTIVEALPTLLSTYDLDMSEHIERELLDRGVVVRKETPVEGFEPRDGSDSLGYVKAGGQRLEADMALVAVGVRPVSELAAAAGIELGQSRAIRVDSRQVTSVPSVLAAGDCCESRHRVTGKQVWIPLGTTANRQGKIAGENAVGGSVQFAGVVGSHIMRVFGLEVSQTGLTETVALDQGLDAVSNKIRALSRSHPFPGAAPVNVKLVFDRETGRLFGGQIVGRDGGGKRIDTVAAALCAGMTVGELADVDLSYSPPFSPVWDPVAMAALQAKKKVGVAVRQQ
jgi:NADPH-dependent 2,4-dienoyl-CoA reductase/sulfur reductase-like enzyme